MPEHQPTPHDDSQIASFEGACPGAAGRVRVRYGTQPDLSDAESTDWAEVSQDADFSHQFRLDGLRPNTLYFFATETSASDQPEGALLGSFKTAPEADASSRVRFVVMTCQGYPDRDRPDGHQIYESMLRLEPDFIVPNGDIVYYDNDPPRARSVELARHHWHRMYSLPTLLKLHLRVPGYWTKDDHDLYVNDCWPDRLSDIMSPLTYEQGLAISREQVPSGEKPYRTFRRGKHVQIWLVEGREFRSPNTMEDGPEKSIWGAEQKAWLQQSILDSDADWKILISPTPLVGPDRTNKRDNHANRVFSHEGREIRSWLAENCPDNLFAVCGDRHWQYHSIDPETGVQEFSVGPASDEHAAGTPGHDAVYHRFHRSGGGFLSVTVEPIGDASRIVLQLHDVNGDVVYEVVKQNSE